MRTLTINIYKFDELDEIAQNKAKDNYRYHGVDHDWWDFLYEDAIQVGLKIQGFDTYRYRIDIKFDDTDGCEVTDLILATHGENTTTYKIAELFKKERDLLVEKHSDNLKMENYDVFDVEEEDLIRELLSDLGNAYLKMLSDEHEYRTSDEYIKEFFEANEYEFNTNGEIF